MRKAWKATLILLVILLLSSCWMLNEAEIAWTANINQNFNGIDYDPVNAVIDWQSEFDGLVMLSFSVKVITIDEAEYHNSAWTEPVGFKDTGTFEINIDTEGKQMMNYVVTYSTDRL